MVSAAENPNAPRPRVLIIEPDPAIARQLCAVLERGLRHSVGFRARHRWDESCCTVIASLGDLMNHDMGRCDVVLCAAVLPDGTGLDALAHVQGTEPNLPVVLVGGTGEAEMAAEAIRAGASDFVILAGCGAQKLPVVLEKSITTAKIRHDNDRLQRDLARSLAELEMKNQQLEAVISQLEAMARTDELTGLANRRWLNLVLEGSWAEATRHDLPLAFLMLDLDGFKALNDAAGHQRGDEMLRLTARIIQANCREVDTVARYGGDEFCVLMPHTLPREALQVAQRILRAFDEAMSRRPDDEADLGVSIGLAHIDLSRPVNVDQLVRHADEAMYSAKAIGKSRVMIRGAQESRPELTLN